MKPVTITECGNILGRNYSTLLRMWDVAVPAGVRMLRQHQHLNFEIMYVNSGSGIYSLENRSLEIQKGDLFVFSGNEQHCITDVGEEGLHMTNLQFVPHFLCEHAPEIPSAIDINFFFHHSMQFENRIKCEYNEIAVLLFHRIRKELAENIKETPLMVKSLLIQLMILLIRHYHYQDERRNPNQERLHCIHRGLEYIGHYFTDNISLHDIADAAGLSSAYFSTVFKNTVGIPLWDYINSMRIEKACQLILSEERPGNMVYVAQECGFNNTANFNKAFRKYTGMSPREYKAGGFSNIS